MSIPKNTIIIVILLIFYSSKSLCSEINLNISYDINEEDKYNVKITLFMEVSNQSEKPVYVEELNGETIGIEIELWTLGRGIKLWQKNDAERRRAYAFILPEYAKISPGEKRKYIFKLQDLLPDDPDNDELAKSIIKSVQSLRSGEGRISVRYCNSDGNARKYFFEKKDFEIIENKKDNQPSCTQRNPIAAIPK